MIRNVLRNCAVLGVVLVLLACSQEQPAEQGAGVRNLLLVCFDTARFDSLNIASLGESGDPRLAWPPRALRFGNALAPAPWTVPSVASVLTGRDPLAHGAGVFSSPVANADIEVPSGISPQVPTLAERLGSQGFETVAFVANPWLDAGLGLERGFDSVTEDFERRHLEGRVSRWLNWRTSRPDAPPFFLYAHLMDSYRHGSWTFEQRRRRERFLLERSVELALASAPGGVCDDHNSTSCGEYLAYVRSIAEQFESLGRILRTLEQTGQLEHTVVVLYSDHGEAFNDHGNVERERAVDPRGVYGVGHGQSLYQEQLHVPLWVWHPDLEGREVLGPVSLLDIVPTALDWLGLEPDPALDGLSLAPWLAGAGPAPDLGRPLYATRIAYGPEQTSVMRLPWKQINRGPGDVELYSLPEDPGETTPRDEPAVAQRLEEMAAAWLARASTTPPSPPSLSPAQLEKLRSLGYLEAAEPKTAD